MILFATSLLSLLLSFLPANLAIRHADTCISSFAGNGATKDIIVDISGHGDFTSIQAAINSAGENAHILIRKGTYDERLLIEKNGLSLTGESKGETVITQSIARDEWRCTNASDWGVATMNIHGNDILLRNLTILNNYGYTGPVTKTVACPLDSAHPQKQITRNGHQMALRTENNTRLKAVNCRFAAYAGDTVSPWNVQDGMFYFKDCSMEGGVDFYCPRGWAYADHCIFIAHTGLASIWHDGSANADAKTVFNHCRFSGFPGFNLGRYHKDAQFYLLNCRFDSSMANHEIYQAAAPNKIAWGKRTYYFNCHRAGKDFSWYADNLDQAPGHPVAELINAAWVFHNKWNPAE